MGKVELREALPNYIERPVTDPQEALEQAREQVPA
jgi:hypothetical protein